MKKVALVVLLTLILLITNNWLSKAQGNENRVPAKCFNYQLNLGGIHFTDFQKIENSGSSYANHVEKSEPKKLAIKERDKTKVSFKKIVYSAFRICILKSIEIIKSNLHF